ncbi:MAG TPA: sigma-54 dependent transcriptional regulator [Gemmatimonadales bacterium]
MTARVLIVDDERNIRKMLAAILAQEGYAVQEAEDGHAVAGAVQRFEPEIVLLDLVMEPGPSGLAVLEHLRTDRPELIVIMMSGKATLHDAVRATKLGAFQFLEKPLTPESVLVALRAATELAHVRAENRALRAQTAAEDAIVGSAPPMADVRSLIAGVAPTPSRVLISGESGTGKELVARAIHRQSPRAAKPFVAVNCAAVPRDLIESEMFGHQRGAFTGAHADRIGKFEMAHHGTLFLDEIGDLEQGAQAKLLRVLETGTFARVGAEHERTVDVRVVAATNRDLERASAAGRFRADLFYRLNVFPIRVPALRERLSDVPALAAHFAAVAAATCARPPRALTGPALTRLQEHGWPGNVRELANLIERLTIIGGRDPISAAEVDTVLGRSPGPAESGSPSEADGAPGLASALDAFEANLIRSALAKAGGNVADAARRLETDRANLYRRMRRLGIDRNDT